MSDACSGRRTWIRPASESRCGGNNPSRLPQYMGTVLLSTAAIVLAGCGGVQSTFKPASVEADSINALFQVMSVGAVVTWLAVMAIAVYATLIRPGGHNPRTALWLVIGGGVIVPVFLLGSLLVYGLALMPQLRPVVPEKNLRIAVSGEQWWWRVQYRMPAGGTVDLANEIRLPVGESVEFLLTSPDVIHSFWIPALGGKVDMTPGRQTRLVITPTETGVFRGACAEYCGASHARMSFDVVVMKPDAFADWLEHQATPAVDPVAGSRAEHGREAFLEHGCGACHTVRGTGASGVTGPELTHVGSRRSLAAGTLPNDAEALRHFIEHPGRVKPDVHMPDFGMLPEKDVEAIAAYLGELR